MLRRTLTVIPTLFGVSVVVFLALQLAPGDPAQWLLGPTATPESLAALRAELGIDQPTLLQFGNWLAGAFQGDFGFSTSFRQDTFTLVNERFQNTLLLAVPAFLLSTFVGVFLGVIGGMKRGGKVDSILNILAFTGVSMPAFWLGLILILYVALETGLFPVSSMNSPGVTPTFLDTLWHMFLPVLTLSVAPAAVVAQVTRDAFSEETGKLYMRTARAKGCSRRQANLRHALRNTWIPVATTLGLEISYVVGGAVLVENVFNWPGIGKLLVSSTISRDYSVVMFASLVIAVVVVFTNLFIDLIYPLLDPRVRLHG